MLSILRLDKSLVSNCINNESLTNDRKSEFFSGNSCNMWDRWLENMKCMITKRDKINKITDNGKEQNGWSEDS